MNYASKPCQVRYTAIHASKLRQSHHFLFLSNRRQVSSLNLNIFFGFEILWFSTVGSIDVFPCRGPYLSYFKSLCPSPIRHLLGAGRGLVGTCQSLRCLNWIVPERGKRITFSKWCHFAFIEIWISWVGNKLEHLFWVLTLRPSILLRWVKIMSFCACYSSFLGSGFF